jgi:anti-anti-sigma factor
MQNTIKMPKRFDYSANGEFNTLVNAVLSSLNGEKQVFLDCTDLEYIDSAGLGLLVMAHKKVQESQTSIVIVSPKSSVREIFLLANLQKLIEIK